MHTRPRTATITIDVAESSNRAEALVCMFVLALLITLLSNVAFNRVAAAVEPLDTSGRHPLYYKSLPPGAVWQSPAAVSMQQGTFQPVAFSGPAGTKFSLPLAGSHSEEEPDLMAGLMVGAVYRFRITGIPDAIGAELYPTVELIGRIYPPRGLETLYPIPINLSESDLQEALDGNLVTRVVYLEDPQTAIPLAQQRTESRPIDIPLDQDALATADSFGRPVAIVRLGSKSPPRNPALSSQFYFGFPAWAPIYKPEPMPETP